MALRRYRSARKPLRPWLALVCAGALAGSLTSTAQAAELEPPASPLVVEAMRAQPDLRAAADSMRRALASLSQRLSPRAGGRLQAHQLAWTDSLARDCADEFRQAEPRALAACLLPIYKERATTLVELQQPLAGALRYPSLGDTPALSLEFLDGDSVEASRLNAYLRQAVPGTLPAGEAASYTWSALGPGVAVLSGVRHRRMAGLATVHFDYHYIDLANGRRLRGADFFISGQIPVLAQRVDQGLREGVDTETLDCYRTVDPEGLARQLETLERVELGLTSIHVDLDLPVDCRALRGATVEMDLAHPFLAPRYRLLVEKKPGQPH